MELETNQIVSESALERRAQIKIHRIEGERNRATKKEEVVLWFDTRATESPADPVFSRMIQTNYTGVVLYRHNVSELVSYVSDRLTKVFHAKDSEELSVFLETAAPTADKNRWVISSSDAQVLTVAAGKGFETCYRAYVDDGQSLHQSIEVGVEHPYLMVSFRDPTNIPLELVIASLQATRTILIKEITDPRDAEDAIVTLGVMEVGADGVMYSPREISFLDKLLNHLERITSPSVSIEVATVIRSLPVGMGYRSCIDLATLFNPNEGMIVGSTSQGGILCCPEVFFLPYMELRPFRVNAGAVHSYVYNRNNRTDYMSELRAGSEVMISDVSGQTRTAVVGRMKTEMRPLRLIEAEFAKGEKINILMQDDWHVRIFSEDGKPFNITELQPGSKILAHPALPGRHVGIKVDEHIIEK